MNYEEFYAQLTPFIKPVKDFGTKAAKQSKTIVKDFEEGNLNDLSKTIKALEDSIAAQKELLTQLQSVSESFDTAAYFNSGDFEKDMLAACESTGVTVHPQDAGSYEMFPCSVKVNAARAEVTLNRKKLATARPAFLAKTVKARQDAMNKEKFNAEAVAKEFAMAYDIAIAVTGKRPGTPLNLMTVYKYLAPTSRAKKEYDKMAFSFDVARLYNSHFTTLADNRSLHITESHEAKGGINALDVTGKEVTLTTISIEATA